MAAGKSYDLRFSASPATYGGTYGGRFPVQAVFSFGWAMNGTIAPSPAGSWCEVLATVRVP